MEHLDFSVGAPVRCRDNESAKLVSVVLDTDGQHVTDVVVERGLPFISKEARVVPLSLVEGTQEDTVWLSVQGEQLADYPAYTETTIEVPDPTASAGEGFSAPGTGSGYIGGPAVQKTIRKRLRQGVAEHQIMLTRQTEFKTLHNSVGHFDRLLVDKEDGSITHLVARRGLLRSDHPVIPMEMVESIGDESVLLATSTDAIDELPRYNE